MSRTYLEMIRESPLADPKLLPAERGHIWAYGQTLQYSLRGLCAATRSSGANSEISAGVF